MKFTSFVLVNFFSDERENLFDKITLQLPDFRNFSLNEKFKQLMVYNDKIVSKYVENTWFKRKSKLIF